MAFTTYISVLWTVHKIDEGSLVLHVFILKAFTFTLLYDNKPVAPQHVFCYSGAWGDWLFWDILSTNNTEMPSLQEWSGLEWVTLRENGKLDCNFSIENRNIYVDTDCHAIPNTVYYGIDAEYFMPEHVELFKLIYAIIFIPFGFTFVSACAFIIKSKGIYALRKQIKNLVSIERRNDQLFQCEVSWVIKTCSERLTFI